MTNSVIERLREVRRNVADYSDFDLCTLRTEARKLVVALLAEEDLRDAKEEHERMATGQRLWWPR